MPVRPPLSHADALAVAALSSAQFAAPLTLGAWVMLPRHELATRVTTCSSSRCASGPKTLRNRFYQVPHCTGLRRREAVVAGAAPRASRPRAAGRRSTPSTARSAPSPTRRRTSRRACGTSATCACSPRPATRRTGTARWPASSSRTRARTARTASRACPRPRPRRSRATSPPGLVPRAMTKRDIRRVQARLGARGAAVAHGRLRHRLRLRRAHLPAGPVPLARTTTAAATSTAARSPTARASGSRRSRRCARAVGDDCAIACRVAVDRMGALGVDLEEGLEFVRLADHLVDLWDVTVGSIAEWSLDSGPSRFFAEGWQLESTARVREATAKPIVGVEPADRPRPDGRDRAQRRVGSDRRRPALDRRSRSSRARSTRAASTRSASASAATSASPRPTADATSAAPRTRPRARSTGAAGIPSASRRCAPGFDALVVGGGPAGMECALTLARRGAARVRLVERAPAMGGHLGLAHPPARPRPSGAA